MSRKWVYGKQDWKTYERGQENCYLMTNGLGGFSSMTMTGSVARNDHAFFMACTKAPNNRYNMVHRLAEKKDHLVYLLWGSYAQKKGAFIDQGHNLVLKSAHPSPLSAYRGFFGNKHFSKTNDYLIATGQEPIDW